MLSNRRRVRVLVAAAVGMLLVLPGGGVARAEQWQERVTAGATYAAGRDTTIEIAWLDRLTGEYRDNGPAAHTPIESASVMKVFIAEYLLYRRDSGQIRLSATDLSDLSRMLRESANAPANRFWSSYGNNGIVSDVIRRYGLTETRLTSNIRYWGNTLITASDMVVFYRRLMDGSGGLSAASRDWIVEQMRQSTMFGDGGRQFFGLRDGLPRERVIAQKQGWMCCVNGGIYRHSTGFTGPDSRFVVVVLTREPSTRGTAHIEESISGAVRAMFPEGLVPRVQGQIGEMWYRMGAHRSLLGLPTTDEIPVRGGAVQYFDRGGAYWSPGTGPRWVIGSILQRYRALGYETGRLGYPTSNEIRLAGGALSRFQGGYVYWSPSTGARAVWGSILKTYGAQGWEKGRLGYPTSNEIRLAGGALSRFQGGYVYWSPGNGAHALSGDLLEAYAVQGYERGALGYPVSDSYAVEDGLRMDFQGGSLTVPTGTSAAAAVPDTSPGTATVPTSTPAPTIPVPSAEATRTAATATPSAPTPSTATPSTATATSPAEDQQP